MKLTTLDKLFHHELKDLYDAEHQIVKALPKLAAAAKDPELAAAFEEHLAQTREHIARLGEVFNEIGETPARETCAGMKGLLEEGNKTIEEDADPVVKDAALISAAQRVEHYEMAAYGTLRTWARILGHTESARLLEVTLDEEEGTDSALTGIASGINPAAAVRDDTERDTTGKAVEKSGRTGATDRKPRQRQRAPSKSASRR
jgi:ferritin-like metal-binding protein YciE